MWAKENRSVQVGGEEDTWDLLLTGMLQDQRQEEKYRRKDVSGWGGRDGHWGGNVT